MAEEQPESVPSEIRLALVVTGGVSLAVWMGGVVTEIARLVRGDGPYGDVLRCLDTRVEVDVIGGSSAGGISGGVLAMALSNGTDPAGLRDLWLEHSGVSALIRPPDDPDPASILLGDEYFLPHLADAFRSLVGTPTDPDAVPVHLIMTATLLEGRRRSFRDDFGNRIPDLTHLATFTFRRGRGAERDDFALPDTAERLALAARCTASFPGAFEPAYCPVGRSEAGRPDMAWHADFHEPAFLVDGGVLMNKPLEPVLRTVLEQPGEGTCRRVLAYVDPAPDIAGRPAVPGGGEAGGVPPAPGMARVVASSFLLPRVESLGRELEAIADHNRRVEAQRRLRRAVLGLDRPAVAAATDPVDVGALGASLFGVYRTVRAAAVAGFALRRVADEAVWQGDESVPWSAATLGGALRDAVLGTLPGRFPADDAERAAFPLDVATVEAVLDTAGDVANAVADLAPAEADRVVDAISGLYQRLHDVRARESAYWSGCPLPSTDPKAWAAAAVAAAPDQGEVLRGVVRRAVAILQPVLRDDPRFAPSLEAWLFAAVIVQGAMQGGETEIEQPVELVQISAHAANGFDERVDAAEKLAGLQLAHFGGFYKRSWRANDWMWGRLDAAARLLEVVLQPAALAAQARRDPSVAARLLDAVRAVVTPPDRPDVAAALAERVDLEAVAEELAFLRDPSLAAPPAVPLTVGALARRLQLQVLQEELPNVALAVEHDRTSGGALRPEAAAFSAGVLAAAEVGGAAGPLDATAAAGLLPLCRIGAERLEDEAGSALYDRVSERLTRVMWTAARHQVGHRQADRTAARTLTQASIRREAPGLWGPLARGLADTTGALVVMTLLMLIGAVTLSMSLANPASSAWASIPSAVLLSLGVGIAALRPRRRVRTGLLVLAGVVAAVLVGAAVGAFPDEVASWLRPGAIGLLVATSLAVAVVGDRVR